MKMFVLFPLRMDGSIRRSEKQALELHKMKIFLVLLVGKIPEYLMVSQPANLVE
ncbi:MAG: hypothetical protein F6K22_21965 [Okeania sp. SIO2F4]|uniref:hypothetical protein n=1 Tax=Okeania sp. SIO2F4 TaxID=2607790 RepID=UPI00142B87D0|nr:hypothetical protein [Okeania sp. SIO2F4]NES05251.1 hypothetical protein [Okeania sp. SIO2F4]